MSARALSASLVASKAIFPMGEWMMPPFSTRNSTLPALVSWMALAMSKVTVPVLGFGIRPRGPSTRPSRPTDFIMSGVAMTASKSIQPCWIFCTRSSPPTKSAPAASASFTFSPPAMATTRTLLPRPCGSTTVPRTIWSACLGSTPRFSASSTVSSNLVKWTFFSSAVASSIAYGRFSTWARAWRIFFPLRATATLTFGLLRAPRPGPSSGPCP